MTAAEEAKIEGMNRAADGAPEEWKHSARRAVCRVMRSMAEFTSDDVWATGLAPPPDPRALGPILGEFRRLGLIEKTGRSVPTLRESRHGTDISVWRSILPKDNP